MKKASPPEAKPLDVEPNLSGLQDTEIGSMPVEWEVVPLKRVAGFARKPRDLDLAGYKSVPFIPMELVPEDGTTIEQYELREGSDIRSGTYCERGDILLAKITPSFENGKQGIVGHLPLEFAYATTEVYPIHAHPEQLDQMFLFHYLRLSSVRNDITGKMEGSTGRQRIPKAVIESYPLPLPPLPEQRRIAHVLSTIQRAIAAQEDVIAAAKETKHSLVHRLFTYGPGAEPDPTKETEIGEIPAHWERVRVDDVFEIKLGKMLSKAARMGVSPRPYLRNANVQWGYFDLDEVKEMDFAPDEMDVFRLRKDDILICEGGEIGRTAIWEEQLHECYYQKALHRLRPKAPNILPRFFLYYMILVFLVRQIAVVEGARSTIADLPVAKLRMVPVALPPLREQRQLVEQIGAVDSKIAAEVQRKAALQALFQSMLHQLMTGQVRVDGGGQD